MASEKPEDKFKCNGCDCLFENPKGLFIIGENVHCDYCLYKFDMRKMKLIHCNCCGVLCDSNKGFWALKETSKANFGKYTSPTVCGTCKESPLFDCLNIQTGIEKEDWRDAEEKDMASPDEIKTNDFTEELDGVLEELEGMPQIAMTIIQNKLLNEMAKKSEKIGKLLVENHFLKFQMDVAKDCEIDDIRKLYEIANMELEEFFEELYNILEKEGVDFDD